jgi:hypothetical protein
VSRFSPENLWICLHEADYESNKQDTARHLA